MTLFLWIFLILVWTLMRAIIVMAGKAEKQRTRLPQRPRVIRPPTTAPQTEPGVGPQEGEVTPQLPERPQGKTQDRTQKGKGWFSALGGLTPDDMIRSIIIAEVLGRPRSLRR